MVGSAAEWQMMSLPTDLTNKLFLEIGCCGSSCLGELALHKGAAQVKCVPDVERSAMQSIDKLHFPEERGCTFDWILWRNALDGYSKPKLFADDLRQWLSVGGTLVVEVRIATPSDKQWVLTGSGAELTWLPTSTLFYDIFESYAARYIGPSPNSSRTVWHLTPRRPNVTLLFGMGSTGKTVRLRDELAGGAVSIRLDHMLSMINNCAIAGGAESHPEIVDIAVAYRSDRISQGEEPTLLKTQLRFASYLNKTGRTEMFAEYLTGRVTDDFHRYVIEGGMLTDRPFRDAVTRCLERKGMKVWHLTSAS